MDFMTMPIFNQDGNLTMIVQVLAKTKSKTNQLSAGFTNFDEIFLSLFVSCIQLKVHQLIASTQWRKT